MKTNGQAEIVFFELKREKTSSVRRHTGQKPYTEVLIGYGDTVVETINLERKLRNIQVISIRGVSNHLQQQSRADLIEPRGRVQARLQTVQELARASLAPIWM